MKNLRVFPARLRDLASNAIGFCIDADNDTIFIISEKLNISKTSLGKRTGTESLTKIKHDFAELLETKITANSLLCFEYLVEFNSVLVGLQDGNIFRIGVVDNDSVNHHHSHMRNLDSVQISPNQDLIALSDSDNNIFLLNSDFEQVAESNALTNEDSKHKSVGVGWGSKETQFFGLDGRPAKEVQAKKSITLTDEELNLYDKVETSSDFVNYMRLRERNTIIDWRGDGQYIASLTYISDIDKHQLKVWNKGLELQFMSDKLINIERGLLHWVPNGNFVCCAQRRDKKINEILSLEKNGMIHMRLELPTKINNLYVDNFSWSPDSSILAVLGRSYSRGQDKELIKRRTMLMLFTLSNHNYYLKHSRYLNEPDIDYSLKWNANDNSCLFILSEKGSYLELHVTPFVDYCDDKGNIVVIDGNKLLITPLKICSVPPPMSALVIELPELIKGVGLLNNKADKVAILTIDDNLILIDENYRPNPNSRAKVICNRDRLESTLPTLCSSQYHTLRIPDNKQYDFIVPLPSWLQSGTPYITSRFTDKGCELYHITIIDEQPTINSQFLGIITNKHIISLLVEERDVSKGCSARVLNSDGSVDKVVESIESERPTPKLVSSNENSLTGPIYNLLQSELDVTGRVITLTSDQTLCCDAKIISSKDCTSFRLTSQFLLYTTSCTLSFVPLSDIDKPGLPRILTQKIENGAHLIVVDPEEARVVLQMPRGNLEIIHPRLLVLCLIQELMIEKMYVIAIKIARHHRLNMNFVADCLIYRSSLDGDVYDAIQEFADTLLSDEKEGESLLILFLNELEEKQEELFGRYSSLVNFIPLFEEKFKDKSSPRVPKLHFDDTPEESRYNLVLNPLIDMRGVLPLKVSLMIGIKIKPANFVKPLLILAQDAMSDKDFDEGIKFLLYHGHVNELYNDAIKAHETKLALMIAKKSSKDPKEYLPVLKKFDSIEPSVLKFYEMSLYVNDNEEALKYLIEYHLDGEFKREEVFADILELVDKKKLYKAAFENFLRYRSKCDSSFERCFEIIATKFAAYMLAKRYYLQAGLLYSISLRLSPNSTIHFNGGVKCFELCDRIDLSYPLYAKYTPNDPKDKMEVLTKLRASLTSKSKPFEATVVRMYMDETQRKSDIDTFIESGPAGYYYADLLSGSNLSTRKQIFEEYWWNHMLKFRNDWNGHIKEALDSSARLKDLISGYFNKRGEQGAGGSTYLHADDTLSTIDGSEASSLDSGSKNRKKSTSGSLKTQDTSKTTKSQAARKKRLNFKRGSRYEDIAVIIKLRDFIEVNKKNQQTAVDLLVYLYEFGYDVSKLWFICQSDADSIRDVMKRSYELAKITIDTFWPTTAEMDTEFSLFERFHDALSKPADEIETIDIEILVRPSTPKEPNYLDLFSFR